MTGALAKSEGVSLASREEQVDEIQRRAQQWRLMDCSRDTLLRMRQALDGEMAGLEERLEKRDRRFAEYVEFGNPSGTEETLEDINRLSGEWERLRKRMKEIDNVLQERYLRDRLTGFLGSERRLNILDGVVLVSIVVVVTMTVFELLVPNLPAWAQETVVYVDTAICIFLLGDFFLRMMLSDDRGWYLRNYWIDFVSSIPFYAILRFGRLVRIVRFMRLLRLLRLTRAVRLLLFIFRGLDKLVKTFEMNLLKRSVLIALALLIFGALAISALEGAEQQSMQDLGESLWWSFSTVVTGGFADLYNPSTATGRVVTVGMILLGLTVTGIFTASLTSVLVEDESSKLEQNQHRFDERLETVDHKLDLLAGETNEALVALEAVAQAISNEPEPQSLAHLLAENLVSEFNSLQASVHLFDPERSVLVRLAHAGVDSLVPPQEVALGEGFTGRVAAMLHQEDMTAIDLEPQSQICLEVQGKRLICPMAGGRRFLGLVHIVLPNSLAGDYLYTRVPMTLAHHAAVAFHAAELAATPLAG